MIGRLDEHIQNYGHGRFQKVKDFLCKEPQIQILDLVYHPIEGGKVRKLYKKYAVDEEAISTVDLIEYSSPRKCKKCSFETPNIPCMFRHIRVGNHTINDE